MAIVLVPLLATATLAVSSARGAWAIRTHAQTVAGDARQLETVALARAQMNRLELPLTAVSYGRQLGVDETVLDSLLHPATPFRKQIAEQVAALNDYPTFSSTPTLRADVAALPDVIVGMAEGTVSFSEIRTFTEDMAATIDSIWYRDFDRLQADVATWSPPGSFEVHVSTLRQAYQAFLAGGQEIESTIYVLIGVGPANSKEELVQAAGEFETANQELSGLLGPDAAAVWRHLHTDAGDVHFAATIQQGLSVAMNGTKSPFVGDLSFAGAAAAHSLQYLADLDKLVTAASQDLRAHRQRPGGIGHAPDGGGDGLPARAPRRLFRRGGAHRPHRGPSPEAPGGGGDPDPQRRIRPRPTARLQPPRGGHRHGGLQRHGVDAQGGGGQGRGTGGRGPLRSRAADAAAGADGAGAAGVDHGPRDEDP